MMQSQTELEKARVQSQALVEKSNLETKASQADAEARVELEKVKLQSQTKDLEKQQLEQQIAAEERQRADERRQEEQRAETLAEPGRQMRQENVALIASQKGSTAVLDRVNPEKLTVYAQATVLEAEKAQVAASIVEHLHQLPSKVQERLGKIVGSIDKTLIYWDRVFDVDDKTGEGFYYDLKIRANASEGRIAIAARAAGASFSRRETVVGYKEEQKPIMGTRKVRGRRIAKADCGVRTRSGLRCVFPFQYDGLWHKECTNYGATGSTNYRWCATTTNPEGVKQAWDYCTEDTYIRGCVDGSEDHGATYEYMDEVYVVGHETKQIPIMDSRALPEGVSQEQVMDALVIRAAGQLIS